jgi:predicted kinase
LAAAEKKAKSMEDKRKTREKIEAAREKIKAEKEALRKKKENMPPNAFKKMRMALKKKVSKVNDAEDNLKESYCPIMEGVNDPSIFKAVFLAGGPGSGKSFVVGKTALKALGFRLINSDDAFEKGLKKAGLTTEPDDIASAQGQAVRASAKALTGKILNRSLEGRLGLVIDGTGKDYTKIKKQVDMLRDLGYSVHMIFVNTDLETAQSRNNNRDRSLPDDMVAKMWKGVQTNIGKFQALFRSRMIIVDNSEGSNIENATMAAYKRIKSWSAKAPENGIAVKWIKGQKK